MRLKVETLLFDLNCFLWENPDWGKADIVIEYENGGRVFARRAKTRGGYGKHPFNIEWEEKDIYLDQLAKKMS